MRYNNLKLQDGEIIYQINLFPDYYISNYGNIYSYKNIKNCTKGWMKLSPFSDKKGYLYVTLCYKSNIKRRSVHSLVAEYFCKGYKDKDVVNHIDANKKNNIYTNLEWVSIRDNVRKSYKTSGINQSRNYNYYQIKLPDGSLTSIFKSYSGVKDYISINNINISHFSLRYYKKTKEYELITIRKGDFIE